MALTTLGFECFRWSPDAPELRPFNYKRTKRIKIAMPKAILEGYLSVAQAAKELGKTDQTIYNWIEADKIKWLEVGGKPFLSLLEIERLKRDGQQPA